MTLGDLKEFIGASIGAYGSKRITNTDTVTPDDGYVFVAIQAETDTVINTVVGNSNLNGGAIAQEGVRYGIWTSVKLTSGVAIVQQGKRV
jgi:hypothetical protein